MKISDEDRGAVVLAVWASYGDPRLTRWSVETWPDEKLLSKLRELWENMLKNRPDDNPWLNVTSPISRIIEMMLTEDLEKELLG